MKAKMFPIRESNPGLVGAPLVKDHMKATYTNRCTNWEARASSENLNSFDAVQEGD